MVSQEELRALLHFNPDTGVFTWKVRMPGRTTVGQIAGYINNRGYVVISVNKKQYLAHRLAWLYVYGDSPLMIDHINRNTSDNRISNLRRATPLGNSRNASAHKDGSGVRGVCWWADRKKWRAQIRINGRTTTLGLFDRKEDAAAARAEAERRYYGEFAAIS